MNSILTPPVLESGKDLRTFLEELLNYVRSLQVIPGDGISTEQTAEGTVVSVIRDDQAGIGMNRGEE